MEQHVIKKIDDAQMNLQAADSEASFSVISKWIYVCLLGPFVLPNIHSHSLILTLKFLSRTMSKNFHGPQRIFYPLAPPHNDNPVRMGL